MAKITAFRKRRDHISKSATNVKIMINHADLRGVTPGTIIKNILVIAASKLPVINNTQVDYIRNNFLKSCNLNIVSVSFYNYQAKIT